MRVIKVFCYVLVLITIYACSDPSPPNSEGGEPKTDPTALSPPGAVRDWLTFDNLMNNSYPHASPIHNEYFMPVGATLVAQHTFSGTIQVNSRRLTGNFNENYIPNEESFKNFPEVELSFVSVGDALVPLNRDRQVSLGDNSFWGIILDPGTIWSETTDQGWSRASFPFTFISARRNQGHNGIATFLFNDNEVSHLRIQIVQETAPWFKQDIYAQLSVNYMPKVFTQASTVIAAYQQEVDNSVEIRPWEALSIIGANKSEFNSGLLDIDINQTGLIKDGVIYLQPCYTRYGDYPYCRWMRNGAYSMTKSLGASLTMMRLAQVYGEQVYDLELVDYLDVTATHDGWDGVTFGDMLNMSTGVGDLGHVSGSGDIFADENTAKIEHLLVQNSEQEKLTVAFSYGNYSWGAGEIFRYNSVMTFILAAALDNYYKSVAGDNAHLWQMIVEEVYRPIGIQHVPMLETTETEGQRGIAELLHGLYPNVDDIAKLAALLQNGGQHEGQQLLHPIKLQEALFQTKKQGLHSWWEDNQYGLSQYLHGFWSSPFRSSSGCLLQVPYMSGHGGNIFTIYPNGMSAFRFADAESYSPAPMIQSSDKERAICELL